MTSARADVPETWLNCAAKAFLGPRGESAAFLELPSLASSSRPCHTCSAMKCMAMRLGEEFHDVEDVRYLLRALNIETLGEALEIVTRNFDESALPVKTRSALEEMLGSWRTRSSRTSAAGDCTSRIATVGRCHSAPVPLNCFLDVECCQRT